MAFDPKTLSTYPSDPGVYLMKSSSKSVLYVGKAKNLKKRLKQYFLSSSDKRDMIPFLIEQVTAIEILITPSEKEALLLENTLIKKHKPKYNALLKDDKTYTHLLLTTKHKWPMLKLHRSRAAPKKDGKYFGPYTSALAAKQTLSLIHKTFPLRQCSDKELASRKRPCILYSMKKCIAPCVNYCTKKDYDVLVKNVGKFLVGEDKSLLKQLESEMEKASEKLEYERANSILQTIKQIKHVVSNKESIVQAGIKDCDIFSIYSESSCALIMKLLYRQGRLVGSDHFYFDQACNPHEIIENFLLQHYESTNNIPKEILLEQRLPNQKALQELLSQNQQTLQIHTPLKGKKRALIELANKNAKSTFEQIKIKSLEQESLLVNLQKALSLSKYPMKIECFDIANISGSDIVGAMVCFVDGKNSPQDARLYKIKSVSKSDDYASLKEVLERRYSKNATKEELPDLILIDGGKGQLNIASKVLKDLDIASCDLISLSKEQGKHDKGLRSEKVFLPGRKEPLSLDKHSTLLFFLQKVRDEAHRKVLGFHKTRRKKRVIKSALDDISGIGPKKKKALLTHFKSVDRIKKATKEQLQSVKELNEKDIQNLLALE